MRLEGARLQAIFFIEQLSLHNFSSLFLFLLPLHMFPYLFFLQSNVTHTVPLARNALTTIVTNEHFE